MPELVSQRRRWLNGAFFAAVYAQTHFTQIWATDHSIWRKIGLHIEFLYQFIMLAFSFFSLVCILAPILANDSGKLLPHVLFRVFLAIGSNGGPFRRRMG